MCFRIPAIHGRHSVTAGRRVPPHIRRSVRVKVSEKGMKRIVPVAASCVSE